MIFFPVSHLSTVFKKSYKAVVIYPCYFFDSLFFAKKRLTKKNVASKTTGCSALPQIRQPSSSVHSSGQRNGVPSAEQQVSTAKKNVFLPVCCSIVTPKLVQ